MNMPRYEPFLGVSAILLVGLSAVALADAFSEVPLPPANTPSIASSTVSVLPDMTAPEMIPFDTPPEATTTAATSTEEQSTDKKPEAKPSVPAKVTKAPPSIALPIVQEALPAVVTIPAPVTPSGNSSLDATASILREALVNIICYAPPGSGVRSVTGSGVVIDPKGIILTNAHIAQYLLLTDRDVSCTIRTGSPAVDRYEAELIYISPAWIQANANILTQTAPVGTGEYDFAFLAVTKSTTSKPLPATFSATPLSESPVPSGTPIVIATYGAQFLEASQIQSTLYPTIVFGSIKDVFTFALNTIDVLALGGSAAAQEGSSGGGVADASGKLVGIITTSTVEGPTDTRSLAAISASYIRAEFAREMGSSLDELLNGPVSFAVADFAPQIPQLRDIVTAQLQ